MTKIDIFSGFLGAGKTTLIKKLIREAYCGEKLVLIENEFGEIGIDGGFMQEAGIQVNEMNSGCICCSLVGDFSEALEKVKKEYAPDRILIEPSGVGKLSDVIKATQGVIDENTVLNSFCTVADAKKCKMYMKNFGEFYNDQIENASCIVLSHTASLSEDKLALCVELIREHNKEAQIITTDWDEIDGKMILDVIEKENSLEKELQSLKDEEVCPDCGHHHHDEHCGCHDHHHEHDEHCDCHEHHHEHDEHCDCGCHGHHHHADEVFTSWGKETVRVFTKEEITHILSELDSISYGTILRAKGIVKGNDGWIHFDYVPGEADVRSGSSGTIGRICVIGANINEEKLGELFNL